MVVDEATMQGCGGGCGEGNGRSSVEAMAVVGVVAMVAMAVVVRMYF